MRRTIMTTTPDPAPAAAGAAPGTDGPPAADSGMGDKVDVRSLAAQRPGEAMWLLVTEVDGPAGEVFTASIVPGPQPRAFGGDVLLHLAPGPGPQAHAAISVAVWTVAAEVLIPVAAWDLPDDGRWPERIRATVAFAMSAMTEIEQHVSLGEHDPVDLDAAAATAVPGLPWPLAGNSPVAAGG
jgi:hypothetical protein